jgi:hypothetical protein
MTLGNMRANGVRSLAVSCWLCHHDAVLGVDRWPDDVPVPAFGPAYGLHRLRDHRRGRAAKLGAAAGAVELDRNAVGSFPASMTLGKRKAWMTIRRDLYLSAIAAGRHVCSLSDLMGSLQSGVP